MKDVKCPVCGSHNVKLDDVIGICSDEDGKGIELLVKDIVGHCEDCEAELMWKQIFRYLAIEDLEEYK